MRHLIQGFGIALLIASLWYGIWSWMMVGDVLRVKASIVHQYKHLREFDQKTSLEADEVVATGFPFRFAVGIKRLTLSMVDGEETYAVSAPFMTLEKTDAAQGTYRVNLPSTIEVLYAKNGQAPEHYTVTIDHVPEAWLSAADVAPDAPLISYAVKMSDAITLHMVLGAEAQDARFEKPMLSAAINQPIPQDMSKPLELFVGILREALVFHTK